MNKIRTALQAQEYLDSEYSWRIKEISNIKASINTAASQQKKALIRAGVPILYAHWEGFVKTSSEAYINYVSNQNHNYKDLETCFIVRGLKKELNQVAESKKYTLNSKIVEFLRNELEEVAEIPYKGVVKTNSNLSSTLFVEIAFSIGIESDKYETRFKFIDERILKRRNLIAHGEYLDIDENAFYGLCKGVISLLRQYKTDIENSLVQSSYKR